MQHYLHNAQKRADATRCAQERTLAEHTYGHRVRTVVNILQQEGFMAA